MRKYTLLLVLLTCFVASESFAQAYKFTKKKMYTSVGGSLNTMNYFGDIAPKNAPLNTEWSLTRPSISIYAQQRFTPRISGRLSFSWGRLEGDDQYATNSSENFGRPQRNLHFRNDVLELAGVAIIDLLDNQGVYYRRPQVPIPYLMVGISYLFNNPEAKAPLNDLNGSPLPEGGQWIALRSLRPLEGDAIPAFVLAIPLGIGLRYKLTNNIDIGIEASLRIVFSDYLDGVSDQYVDMTNFTPLEAAMAVRSREQNYLRNGNDRPGETIPNTALLSNGGYPVPEGFGMPGDQRGSPEANDAFTMIGLHVSYIFPGAIKSPKFR